MYVCVDKWVQAELAGWLAVSEVAGVREVRDDAMFEGGKGVKGGEGAGGQSRKKLGREGRQR